MNEAGKGDGRTVFVVHGRNQAVRDAIFAFLRAINLAPIEWSQALSQTGDPDPFVGQVLDCAFTKAQAAVVILTGDDMARLRPAFCTNQDKSNPYETMFKPQARSNVLFEAGIAIGRLPSRTVFVQVGDVRPFSDRAGKHILYLDDSAPKRQQLAERLKLAGCQVNLSGEDWYKVGHFDVSAPTSSPELVPMLYFNHLQRCSEMAACGRKIHELVDVLRTGFVNPLRRQVDHVLARPDDLKIRDILDGCHASWEEYCLRYQVTWPHEIMPVLGTIDGIIKNLRSLVHAAELNQKARDCINRSITFYDCLKEAAEGYQKLHTSFSLADDLLTILLDTKATANFSGWLWRLSTQAKTIVNHADFFTFNSADAALATLQVG